MNFILTGSSGRGWIRQTMLSTHQIFPNEYLFRKMKFSSVKSDSELDHPKKWSALPWQWHLFYCTLILLAYVSTWIMISLFRAFMWVFACIRKLVDSVVTQRNRENAVILCSNHHRPSWLGTNLQWINRGYNPLLTAVITVCLAKVCSKHSQ